MKNLFLAIAAIAVLISAGSCDKLTSENGGELGRIIIKVTDDPFDIDQIESATITISKIEVRNVSDTTGSAFIVVSDDTATIDLLNLRNGVTEELANIDIPAGKYDLIRLYVSDASLTLKGESEPIDLKIPSGQQTGIKIFIKPAVTLSGGLSSELLLDFDLSKSFVKKDSGKGFNFKPVVRVANVSTSGSVKGIVTDTSSNPIANAKVWIEQDTVFASTYSDTFGKYAIIGIPEGVYSLLATSDLYDTALFSGISVIPGNQTIKNIVLIQK